VVQVKDKIDCLYFLQYLIYANTCRYSLAKTDKYETSSYYYPSTDGKHFGIDQVYIVNDNNATVGASKKAGEG
jgi:hypothetical protein